MNLQLIQGQFSGHDALTIITQMIRVKIKHHESKIEADSSEEDIKYRETKIKRLQKELYELRTNLSAGEPVSLQSIIEIKPLEEVKYA